MAYATIAQLSARLGATLYGRLTDRVNGVTADEAVAQQIVEEAEAEVNSYVAVRYVTPVDVSAAAELADLLAARVLDLAEYNAWKSSPFVSSPPVRVNALYEAARRWLVDVASGAVALPGVAEAAAAADGDEAPAWKARERVWTGAELESF